MIPPWAWDDPPTARQLRYLRHLGVKGHPPSKGEASNWIARALGNDEHDHSEFGPEYLRCLACGHGFEGVEGLRACPECGGHESLGVGWICCVEPYELSGG